MSAHNTQIKWQRMKEETEDKYLWTRAEERQEIRWKERWEKDSNGELKVSELQMRRHFDSRATGRTHDETFILRRIFLYFSPNFLKKDWQVWKEAKVLPIFPSGAHTVVMTRPTFSPFLSFFLSGTLLKPRCQMRFDTCDSTVNPS